MHIHRAAALLEHAKASLAKPQRDLKRITIAGGLSIEEIDEQHREADRLNKKFGTEFRILKGIESDILVDVRSTIRTMFWAGSTTWLPASAAVSSWMGRPKLIAS